DEEWDCGYSVDIPGGKTSKVICDGPIRCMGEECVSPPRETNPDFGKAAGMLSALNFMTMDMNCVDGNPDSCTIFAGEPMECKQALGGYKDCCNVPVSVGLADYLKLTIATYKLGKDLKLGTKLAATVKESGAWKAVSSYLSDSTTWQTITKPLTSAWE